MDNDGGTIKTLTRGTTTTITIDPLAYVGARNMVPLVGMWVYFSNISGTTQLEGKLALVTASNVATRTITVAIDTSAYSPYVFSTDSQVWCYWPSAQHHEHHSGKLILPVVTTDGANGLVPNTGFYCFVTGVSGMTQINGVVVQGTRTSNTVWTAFLDNGKLAAVLIPAAANCWRRWCRSVRISASAAPRPILVSTMSKPLTSISC